MSLIGGIGIKLLRGQQKQVPHWLILQTAKLTTTAAIMVMTSPIRALLMIFMDFLACSGSP